MAAKHQTSMNEQLFKAATRHLQSFMKRGSTGGTIPIGDPLASALRLMPEEEGDGSSLRLT